MLESPAEFDSDVGSWLAFCSSASVRLGREGCLVLGWCSLLVPSSCLTRSGIVLKPSPLCKTIQELEIRQTQADRARFVERTLQPAGSGDYFSDPCGAVLGTALTGVGPA